MTCSSSKPIVAFACVAAALACLLPPDTLDTCLSVASQYFKPFNAATEAFLNTIVAAIVLLVLLCDRSYRSLQALGCSITSSFSLLVVVVVLKEALRDTSCSNHANSVSGHAAVHFFALISLRDCLSNTCSSHWHTALRRLHPIVMSIVLTNTYVGGYHSLRQLLLGFILSSLFIVVYLASSSWMRAHTLRCTIVSALTFAAVTSVAMTLPHEQIPLRLRHLFMYAVLPQHAHHCAPVHVLPFVALVLPFVALVLPLNRVLVLPLIRAAPRDSHLIIVPRSWRIPVFIIGLWLQHSPHTLASDVQVKGRAAAGNTVAPLVHRAA
jgi:hypothetical protein